MVKHIPCAYVKETASAVIALHLHEVHLLENLRHEVHLREDLRHGVHLLGSPRLQPMQSTMLRPVRCKNFTSRVVMRCTTASAFSQAAAPPAAADGDVTSLALDFLTGGRGLHFLAAPVVFRFLIHPSPALPIIRQQKQQHRQQARTRQAEPDMHAQHRTTVSS